MNRTDETLKTMGKRIREVEDRRLPDNSQLATTKERLIFDPAFYKKRSVMRPVVGALVAAAAAAAVLLLLIGQESLTVSMDGRPLPEGGWVSSSTTNASLTFSDGSRVQLQKSSGLRVRGLTPNGAHLLLERGSLEVDVVHRDTTSWKLEVGPYLITVVGTRFFLGWNPETEELSLHMKQGKVTVEGPMIPSRSVGEGETLFASLSKGTMEINYDMPKPSPALDTHQSMPADPIVTTGGVTIGDATKTEEKAEGDVDRPSSKKKSESSEIAKRATWQELADEGRFKEAVEAAEKIGINRILEEFSADDLLSLGDAARHSASLTTANRAYKAIRSRFPGTAYASSAAFALGLMAFDQQKDYAAAAGWFQASLNDRSNGALSKEALGRLMEALNLKGDKAAAEKAAARYLLAYPSGPHAALARRLTDSR